MFIKVKDAVKQYGEGNNVVYALNHANLELERDEICVIMGPSGSGKSTLLNILGGLDTLDSGDVIVGENIISNFNTEKLLNYRRKSVGFIFQFYNLIMDLTVKENIEIVSDISEKKLNIDEVMKALDIYELRNRFPKELSGGQQQRVSIARALIKNPDILFCDEPTGALDSKSSKEVLRFIQKINNLYHTLIIIVTHNEDISKISDRIVKLKDGKIISNNKNKRVDIDQIQF